ncbi:MAG TPA: nucleotide exchange factor GrpE [Deltaproteobacteria bacterium]|nr:nucleotide exchange factor GrpE [Deltaproteobacteria bacterium]
MSDKKKKIEKYTEAEQIGKEDQESAKETDKDKPDNKKIKAEETDPVQALGKEAESAKQEAQENYDKYLRVSAEFDNYKKRSSREMNDFRKYANEALLREMLTVVDNLERAIDSSNDHVENNSSVVEGVRMTLSGILDLIEKHQVSPIESVGKPFDPQFHQAFQQEESEDHQSNTVLKEFQKGYLLHDRLLRPAMVVVSKKTETPDPEKAEDDNASEKE